MTPGGKNQPVRAMNQWVFERALRQVLAAMDIMRVASEASPGAEATPNSIRERLTRDAWSIFYEACTIIAYSCGRFNGLTTSKATAAFDKGHEAMLEYANSLYDPEAEFNGWELPNPAFYSILIPIDGGPSRRQP